MSLPIKDSEARAEIEKLRAELESLGRTVADLMNRVREMEQERQRPRSHFTK